MVSISANMCVNKLNLSIENLLENFKVIYTVLIYTFLS